jgi:myo-inositol-1(or 4)-monophosphatase
MSVVITAGGIEKNNASLQVRLMEAVKVAKLAGLQFHERFASPATACPVETKASQRDLVTAYDKACDALILAHLQATFPTDLFLTEESYQESQPIDLSHTWVIDPIDGTTNFAHAFPQCAVSIAYVVDAQPVVGVVYNPITNELFTATKNGGAHLNGVPLQVSSVRALSHSLLATGFPNDQKTTSHDNMGYFLTFMEQCHGVRRLGSAALDLAYTAMGRLDGFWELRLSPWDIAAAVLMITEAGGCVTGWQGQPLRLDQRKIDIIGSNGQPSLHQEIVAICSKPAGYAVVAVD